MIQWWFRIERSIEFLLTQRYISMKCSFEQNLYHKSFAFYNGSAFMRDKNIRA